MCIREFLKNNLLYLDGGMGTLLQSEGLAAGELPERLNLTRPELIRRIHKDYFDAGSNVVSTNTFGANALKYSEQELDLIIKSAVENAKAAKETSRGDKEKWIALDVGPTGKMLAPYGDLAFEDAVEIFAKTVRLGVKYGVDLIFIETFTDSYETKAAVLAAKENSDLPIFVSNAYGEDGKLMTGANPEAMVALLEGLSVDAIGANCSFGPKKLSSVVNEYLRYASVPVLLKPNAGLPELVGGRTVYSVLPEEFAEDVLSLIEKGVRIAGGCCGTTPEYISALTQKSANVSPISLTEKCETVVSSYTHAVRFEDKPILIGERINPTGKKRFKEALLSGDIDYILKEGIAEEERGVHILDVNVGLPEIDETEMLTRTVRELQAITSLPLQLDTSNSKAMEAALRAYNGKALVNSVSGKKESIEAIFPLVKKYGGVVVCLTLDEDGIPETAEGRVKIAEKILFEAEKYGIKKKDLIFDPLALTVSADKNAARETLRAVGLITKQLHCKTTLGVSNVSFGLPQRDTVNASFFTMALAAGLCAAIMNPYSTEMMRAYHAYLALAGLDESFEAYIKFSSELPKTPQNSTAAPTIEKGEPEVYKSELQRAVVKGLRERAAGITEQLLKTENPLDIIQNEIIPALNTVGEGYESKRLYLPQLLMSAEASKAAFEKIKASVKSGEGASKCRVVLATVKGDIHDI